MGIKYTSNLAQFTVEQLRRMDIAMLKMATDIDRTSAMLAPKLTRALVKSKKITRHNDHFYGVSYGNQQVPYARRRHFENKAHPATLRYLERAGNNVGKNASKYFEGLI